LVVPIGDSFLYFEQR